MITKYRRTLSGTTLTEVLVMMIVAGVVFLGVMDGLGMLRRYTAGVAERITRNSRFYDGYYRLEDLVTGADSITGIDTRIVCWRGGAESAVISVQDSLLISRYGHISDTLMQNVASMRAVSLPDANRIDSLVVGIRSDGKEMTVSFPATPPVQAVAKYNITRQEKEYEYE